MARPLRIEYPEAWYHVMNRGRRKDPIFYEENDYKIFIKVLKQTIELHKIEVHAYALMPNHYHILIKTPEGNISRAMRHLNGVYTQKINKKYSQDGQLFRGRYKSIIVSEEEYLLELLRYIHRNPYRANLEEELGNYKWCSHRRYIKGVKEKEEITSTEYILSKFGNYEKESRGKLKAFVSKAEPKELMDKIDSIKWQSILGGDKFKEKMENLIKGKKIDIVEMPLQQCQNNIRKVKKIY